MAVALCINSSSSAQTNSWISATSGNWQDSSSWSLGVLPGASQDIAITNGGWKAVEINATTAANFPQTLAVDSITISSPTNTVNSLLMNFVGVGSPLVANSVTLNSNSVITLQSSSLQVSNMSVGGAFNQNNFSGVSAATMQIGDVGPGLYTMSNGTLAVTNSEVIGGWGYTAVFDQEGGYHYATPLQVNAGGGEYDLHGGQLGGAVQMSGGVLNQYGGDLALTNFQFYGFYTQYDGTIECSNLFALYTGAVVQSGGTNNSGSLFAGSPEPDIYIDGSSSFTMSNGLFSAINATINYPTTLDLEGGTFQVHGAFSMAESFMPPGYYASGEFTLNGGTFIAGNFNNHGGVFQSGGTNLVAGDLTSQGYSPGYSLYGGLLSTFSTVIDAGNFFQTGGSHVVDNTLSVETSYLSYNMSGGQLTAPNIEIGNTSAFNHSGGGVNNNSLFTFDNGTWNEFYGFVELGRLQMSGPGWLWLTNDQCTVRFADSSGQAWSNGAPLTIEGWIGSLNGDGTSQIYFGNNSNGLTTSQLTNVQFEFPFEGAYTAKILPTGEIVPDLNSRPPFAPTYLGTIASPNRIDLNWTDNAISDTTYAIQRSLDGTNFVQIAVTAANATSYSDTNVSVGVQYYYRVAALGTAGDSYSNVAIGASKLAPPIAGMIAWWRAEGTTEDAVGSHDGSSGVWAINYSPGKVGQAFDFSAYNDRVSIPDSPDFVLTNAFSIEGWIYPRQLTTGFVTLRGDARWGLDTWTVHMEHIPGYLSFQIDDVSNNYVEIDAPVQTNQWTHFAATFDATNGLQLYINGVLAAQTNTTLVPVGVLDQTQGASVGIGNSGVSSDNFPFDGKIDELAIYSRALTPTEIQNIYNTGSLGKLALLSPPASTNFNFNLSPQPGGAMQLNLNGPTGRTYEIDISTDLVHWSPWQTQLNASGTISVTDDTATNHAMGFYRIILLP